MSSGLALGLAGNFGCWQYPPLDLTTGKNHVKVLLLLVGVLV